MFCTGGANESLRGGVSLSETVALEENMIYVYLLIFLGGVSLSETVALEENMIYVYLLIFLIS